MGLLHTPPERYFTGIKVKEVSGYWSSHTG